MRPNGVDREHRIICAQATSKLVFKVHTVPYSALTSNVCTCYLSSELYAMICKTQLRYARAVGGWVGKSVFDETCSRVPAW